MAGKFKYALRVMILVLYGSYALSPIYLSVGAPNRDRNQPSQNYSLGIVWVNVLLSSVLEEQIDGTAGSGRPAFSQQDPDLILIKKKRAVFREQYAVSPTVETITLSADSTTKTFLPSRDYEIAWDPQHRETDGYRSLHAGLSPPQHLS